MQTTSCPRSLNASQNDRVRCVPPWLRPHGSSSDRIDTRTGQGYRSNSSREVRGTSPGVDARAACRRFDRRRLPRSTYRSATPGPSPDFDRRLLLGTDSGSRSCNNPSRMLLQPGSPPARLPTQPHGPLAGRFLSSFADAAESQGAELTAHCIAATISHRLMWNP